MRGAPQSEFASAMVRTRFASSEPTGGRPARQRRDFQVQKARKPCRCQRITVSGRNEVERLSPPSPMVGEPHPEAAIEVPELRSLRAATEQGKLLPERQVLEREVRFGAPRAGRPTERGRGTLLSMARTPLAPRPVSGSVLASDRRRWR